MFNHGQRGLHFALEISEDFIQSEFPEKYLIHFQASKKRYLQTGHLTFTNELVCISSAGLFISDQIMADFMVVE